MCLLIAYRDDHERDEWCRQVGYQETLFFFMLKTLRSPLFVFISTIFRILWPPLPTSSSFSVIIVCQPNYRRPKTLERITIWPWSFWHFLVILIHALLAIYHRFSTKESVKSEHQCRWSISISNTSNAQHNKIQKNYKMQHEK